MQLLPQLSPEEYARLEASIKHKGSCTIEVDETGDILDGNHRYKICEEHGIPVEKIVVNGFENELEKQAYVIKINSARRQMSGDQEELVDKERKRIASDLAACLTDEGVTKYTQEQIGGLLGVAHNTISTWLNGKNVNNFNIEVVHMPRKRVKQKIGKKEKEFIFEQLAEGVTQQTIANALHVDRSLISKIKRNAEKKQEQLEARAEELKVDADSILLGDIRELGQSIEDNSIDLIFTDPPYGKHVIDDYEELAKFAARVLKPGASLLAYSGQSVLPEVYKVFCEHLNYWWTICMEHGGQNQRLPGKFVYIEWKPIIWMVKGNKRRDNHFISDLIKSQQDKDYHEWGQSVVEASYYIEHLTQPKELVCDPFLGGATTLIAAKRLDRRILGFEKDPETYRRIIGEMS